MWKEFFYFSKGERRGVLLLIALIVLVIIAAFWSKQENGIPHPGNSPEHLKAYHSFVDAMQQKDSLAKARFIHVKKEVPKAQLFPFDPNTADSLTFIGLGLRPYIASNILKYRKKGGVFRTPASFAKIYGITETTFNNLQPFINIDLRHITPTTAKATNDTSLIADSLPGNKQPVLIYNKPFKYPDGTVINLNTSDTTELKKIPGIGSGIAHGIVAYRNRLGGYHTVEQLYEISYLPDSLHKWFCIANEPLRLLNLNTSGIERLRNHPYLNFYQSKVIIEFRKRNGRLKDLNQLSLYEEFTKEDLERIKPYVCFE